MERHPVFMDGRLNVDKISLMPKAIYKFNAIPIKIPTACFLRNKKIYPKIYTESQWNCIAKTIVKKKKL